MTLFKLELSSQGSAPEWVQLLPMGQFHMRDGRGPFTLQNPEAVIRASQSLNMDLPIDYDHQIDFTRKNGGGAPAGGWIVGLESREDGIWGQVEWTDRASEAITAKEYRFLSPVFRRSRQTGEVLRIDRAALTNDPALDLIELSSQENDDMELDEFVRNLASVLGLTGEADVQGVTDAVKELCSQQHKTPDLTKITSALKLDGDAGVPEICAAIGGLSEEAQPDPAKYVTIDQYNELHQQVIELCSQSQKTEHQTAVDDAIREGKLTPAQRDWAMELASKDPDSLSKYLDKAIPVIGKQSVPSVKPQPKSSQLSGDALTICSQLGLDEKGFADDLMKLEEV